MRNIRENLFFAFVYNSIGVPMPAGVLYPFFWIAAEPDLARGDELQFGVSDYELAKAAEGEVVGVSLGRAKPPRRRKPSDRLSPSTVRRFLET